VKRANTLQESSIVEIWQNLRLDRTDLVTEEGEPVKIIYPGRLNDDRGGDLLDAVIATSQGLVRGDIEVHVKSSSWWSHRHHQNPSYNRVILHVVFYHDAESATILQNGQKVPTLALHRFIKSPTEGQTDSTALPANLSMPCRNPAARWNAAVMGEILDSAGQERFLTKAAAFQSALAHTEASQSLYEGIMGALGYTKNKLPLLELAQRLPLQSLKSVTSDKAIDMEYLAQHQALLLGTAGLLPSQRSIWHGYGPADEWIDILERIWAASGQTEVMSEDDWHLFKVRPSNYPTRRIAAMSYLLLRYRAKGILAELINKLNEVPADTGVPLFRKGTASNHRWLLGKISGFRPARPDEHPGPSRQRASRGYRRQRPTALHPCPG